jgi:hypothetical protein
MTKGFDLRLELSFADLPYPKGDSYLACRAGKLNGFIASSRQPTLPALADRASSESGAGSFSVE